MLPWWCACQLNQIPVLLGFSVGCNFCWSWLGSPINSCRSGVFCVLGNIACDSELVQMLFIYADILWVLRFMLQCETEDILRVVIACLVSCLFWEILFLILFFFSFIELIAITKAGNKRIQEQKYIHDAYEFQCM